MRIFLDRFESLNFNNEPPRKKYCFDAIGDWLFKEEMKEDFKEAFIFEQHYFYETG